MNRNFRWEVLTGKMKVTQRNRQENKETEIDREGERDSVCACANNISRLIKLVVSGNTNCFFNLNCSQT